MPKTRSACAFGGVRALRGGVVVRDLFRIPGDGPSVAHDAPLAVFDCFDVDDGVIGDLPPEGGVRAADDPLWPVLFEPG